MSGRITKPPAAIRVLLVDDSPHMLRTLTRFFSTANCDVRVALSAEYAEVHMSAPEKIDAIICDGLGSDWQRVAYVAEEADTPILIYSGAARVISEAEHCGLPALLKGSPGEHEALLAFVRDAVGGHR